jgi:AcrR family transcriptional regulator
MDQEPAITDQRKHDILEAAVTVFARAGLEKGKIVDIAKEAGIGKSTVYEYFASKDEIFLAIFNIFFQEFEQLFQQIRDADETPEAKIHMVINSSFSYLKEMLEGPHSDNWPIVMEILAQGMRDQRHGQLQMSLADMFRASMVHIEPIIAAGVAADVFREVEPELGAFVLFAALDGIAMHYYLQRDRVDLEQLRILTTEIIFNGLRKK